MWVIPALLFMFIGVPRAHADTISTFSVSGSFESGRSLSGTFTVNVTTGVLTAVDLTATTYTEAFNTVPFQANNISSLSVGGTNSAGDSLELDFTSTNTPYSFVGLTGGTITNGYLKDSLGSILDSVYKGTITLQSSVTTDVPEPGTLVLLLFGLGALLFVGKRTAGGVQAGT